MSFPNLPSSFEVLFPAFSLPMKAERSRNKERLEASLAGLCELDLLKQRQESRVLSALCLGDSPFTGRPPWGDLRAARCSTDASNCDAAEDFGFKLQTSSLQCTRWGIRASLEQQVAELKGNTDSSDLDQCPLTSGEERSKQNGSPESHSYSVMSPSLSVMPPSLSVIRPSLSAPDRTEETETEETCLSNQTREAMVVDALRKMTNVDPSEPECQNSQKFEMYIFGLVQRRAVPTRPSKPRTSLAHEARAVTVVRQSSLCHKDEQSSAKHTSVPEMPSPSQCSEVPAPQACHKLHQEHYLKIGFTDETPSPYHHHLQQSVQLAHYPKPRQASMMNTSRSTSSCRVLPAHPDSSTCEPDSPQHFHNYPSPPALTKPPQPSSPEELLVNAEYIPAQPCRASTRAYPHHHSNPHKGSAVLKPNRSTYSPESGHHQEQQPAAAHIQPSRSRGGPKKCRTSEDKSNSSRKPGKKACRSQSENSLQRVPERKYNTVERDGGGSGSGGRGSRSSQSRTKKQQQGSSSCRRWQSTLELSQDEADQPPVQTSSAPNERDQCLRRTRKFRPTHASYGYPHHNHNDQHVHHHQHMEYQLERDPVCQDYPHPGPGESESSMSEAYSPESSSLSSDSDESGGLVWPQQLPPQLGLPSPPAPGAPLQPKAFVKIKASHALKKKILRFRTGSLKVMTTV
ncbi:dapper homolog 3-like isoform X1 [Brachyistius frenatus]|uniref:dapper homolog 3-like isoform X1 n=1 Tax=Brachyistius frenatus TaxID=100188 RepID=UPI0037E84710